MVSRVFAGFGMKLCRFYCQFPEVLAFDGFVELLRKTLLFHRASFANSLSDIALTSAKSAFNPEEQRWFHIHHRPDQLNNE